VQFPVDAVPLDIPPLEEEEEAEVPEKERRRELEQLHARHQYHSPEKLHPVPSPEAVAAAAAVVGMLVGAGPPAEVAASTREMIGSKTRADARQEAAAPVGAGPPLLGGVTSAGTSGGGSLVQGEAAPPWEGAQAWTSTVRSSTAGSARSVSSSIASSARGSSCFARHPSKIAPAAGPIVMPGAPPLSLHASLTKAPQASAGSANARSRALQYAAELKARSGAGPGEAVQAGGVSAGASGATVLRLPSEPPSPGGQRGGSASSALHRPSAIQQGQPAPAPSSRGATASSSATGTRASASLRGTTVGQQSHALSSLRSSAASIPSTTSRRGPSGAATNPRANANAATQGGAPSARGNASAMQGRNLGTGSAATAVEAAADRATLAARSEEIKVRGCVLFGWCYLGKLGMQGAAKPEHNKLRDLG
jgi:hypothetical protein